MDATPPEDEDILHGYLWVSHGGNVSGENNFYPMETKFKYLTFYSESNTEINAGFLEKINNQDPFSICKLAMGACPIIPINITSAKKIVYLPPLIFTPAGNGPADATIKQYFGLYYFKIKQINWQNCSLESWEQIFDNDGIPQQTTYSLIFKLVYDSCKKKNIKPSTVMLGIYSCQSKNIDESEYQVTAKNLIPKIVQNISDNALILNEHEVKFYNQVYGVDGYYSPTIIIPTKNNFVTQALAGIKHQGCALNVLSLYNILPKNEATERAVCLNLTGTSIYEIVDYINDSIVKTTVSNQYFILRFPIIEGINEIYTFLENFSINDYYCIIFKLYKSIYKPALKDNVFNQSGHTVSFLKNPNGTITFMDPQTIRYIPMTGVNNVYELLQTEYNGFNYIDVIYTVRTKNGFPAERLQYSLKELSHKFMEQPPPPFNVIPRPTEEFVNHGGKKNKNKNIKSRKLKFRKKMKKYSIKKRNKTKKYSKQHGGNLDKYEQMVIDIDKKNNVQSALIQLNLE